MQKLNKKKKKEKKKKKNKKGTQKKVKFSHPKKRQDK